MKQRKASRDLRTGTKVEPNPKAVSVGRVATMGLQQVRTKPAPPMFKASGFKAPMNSQATHKAGSQRGGKR